MNTPGRGPDSWADQASDPSAADTPAGADGRPAIELAGDASPSRGRRIRAAATRLTRRGGRARRGSDSAAGQASEAPAREARSDVALSGADLTGEVETSEALTGEIAKLAGELAEDATPSRWRRFQAAATRLVRRSGRASRAGASTSGRWLTAQVLAMAPRLPVRDQATLRAQFPGLTPEELADKLIQGSSRSAASVGAAVGAAMFLPLPTAPVEVVVETLALVGIEIKLVAELHEVYGMRAPGPVTDRMLAYVTAWSHRRGVALVPGGLALAAGSPVRRQLQRRLLARAGRSAASLGPLLTGAAAGALLNRHETRRLGQDVRDDLRRRSPYRAAAWPD
jgi:hypothetical protein